MPRFSSTVISFQLCTPPAGLPEILGPRFVAEFARMRNRMKYPHELPGPRVVGVNVGRNRGVVIAPRRQRNDEQVLENAARIVGLERRE